jgi:hypothetical protein
MIVQVQKLKRIREYIKKKFALEVLLAIIMNSIISIDISNVCESLYKDFSIVNSSNKIYMLKL